MRPLDRCASTARDGASFRAVVMRPVPAPRRPSYAPEVVASAEWVSRRIQIVRS